MLRCGLCSRLASLALFIAMLGGCAHQTASMSAPSLPHRAQHVVIVVFDGMRADSVTAEDTPTLYQLSRQGTFFAHHHPVYLSSTEVNGSAIATGAYPRDNGVIANHEYRPEIEPAQPVDTQDEWTMWRGDRLSGGHYLRYPTMTELARRAGMRVVVAGTKPVAALLDHWQSRRDAPTRRSPSVYEGRSVPVDVVEDLKDEIGPIPPSADSRRRPNVQQDRWTTDLLLEHLWKDGVPALTVLWLSEPDYAQHGSGVRSKVARAALRSSDANLARVLSALEKAGVRDKTDVLVVSDHGFSTIDDNISISLLLREAGFDATTAFFDQPKSGQILVASNGGSVCFYVIGHDRGVIERLVSFLQDSAFAGVIFTREKGIEGTFAPADANVATPDAPDVLMSMRWSDEKNEDGAPGLLISEGRLISGQGSHASLSRFDMHNTLVAGGPDFQKGFVDELPTGNADVAPTVLWILGLKAPRKLDGRVLSEAMVDGQPPAQQPVTTRLEAQRSTAQYAWQQYLQITRLGEQTYLDEGNGRSRPTPTTRP